MNKTVLIIEDDTEINDMLRILLHQNGCRAEAAKRSFGSQISVVTVQKETPGWGLRL